MADGIPFGTNCATCPARYLWGETKSEYPASAQCYWCKDYLCSNHAERPFGDDLGIRACAKCKAKIDGDKRTAGAAPLAMPSDWSTRYHS